MLYMHLSKIAFVPHLHTTPSKIILLRSHPTNYSNYGMTVLDTQVSQCFADKFQTSLAMGYPQFDYQKHQPSANHVPWEKYRQSHSRQGKQRNQQNFFPQYMATSADPFRHHVAPSITIWLSRIHQANGAQYTYCLPKMLHTRNY